MRPMNIFESSPNEDASDEEGGDVELGAFPGIHSWLFSHMRLQTKLRLSKFGYGDDVLCSLCAGAEESLPHLFFACPYSVRCVQLISSRVSINIPTVDTWSWWTQTRFSSLFHKKILGAIICALVYYIWKARNHSFHNYVLIRLDVWIRPLIPDLISRCSHMVKGRVSPSHMEWLCNL
ncbi:hypothetical protein RND81_06G000100 [Saponaria officinalis]|uniref:Reverse transcriptase zinc-binding domain-containing protein n=1 Tax=Saponaria officinalis TaxID=3572 RepID=A0AAW1K5I4_SAPOF